MAITAQQVKELRDITGISMMECKEALTLTDGDIDKAIDELRKKGLAKAAKKADRETYEWAIKIATDWDKAYIVSVSCETDFLANSDRYKTMLDATIAFLKANGENSLEAAQEMINKDFALEMGENLQLRTYKIVNGTSFGAYVHSNGKLAALVVAGVAYDEEKLKQVAMHVTASNPDFLKASEISARVIEKERAIQLDMMKADEKMAGKPEDVLLKIIDGKMSKFASEVSLLEQAFVMNPDIKVKDFVGENTLTSFYRFNI